MVLSTVLGHCFYPPCSCPAGPITFLDDPGPIYGRRRRRTGVEHPTFTLKRHPILDVLNTLLIREVYVCFYFTLGKTKNLIKTLFIEQFDHTLFGIVHFKTNYNYRLSNHCFINELILVTYALLSNAVEKKMLYKSQMFHYPANNV